MPDTHKYTLNLPRIQPFAFNIQSNTHRSKEAIISAVTMPKAPHSCIIEQKTWVWPATMGKECVMRALRSHPHPDHFPLLLCLPKVKTISANANRCYPIPPT